MFENLNKSKQLKFFSLKLCLEVTGSLGNTTKNGHIDREMWSVYDY